MRNVVDEYLVKLGAVQDTASIRAFEAALAGMASKADNAFTRIAKKTLELEVTAVSAFAAIGAAVATATDKIAAADQEYRLFGLTMYMNTDAAKKLKITMDALGQPLGMLAWDKELSTRAQRLLSLQDTLQGHLDAEGYEANMVKVRELRFQLTELEVNFEYLMQAVVSGLVKIFGPYIDQAIEKLQLFNLWFAQHLPEIRDKINRYLVPILKDVWQVLKAAFEVAVSFAEVFDTIVGLLSGNAALTGAVTFDKFAASVATVAHWLAVATELLLKFTGTLTGAVLGGAAGSVAGAVIGGIAGIPGGPAGVLLGATGGALTGGLAGTVVGATAGGALDLVRALQVSGAPGLPEGPASAQATAQRALALAKQVSARTGIPADLLWSQWAHETGGFTNRGATSLNNLAGVRLPGSTDYRRFSSLDDFADYYTYLMRPGGRYGAASSARTPAQFASALKAGGYYGDTLQNYTAGISAWEHRFPHVAQQVSVGAVHVVITQPGASAEEVERRVVSGVSKAMGRQVTRNLNEFAGGYAG